ncbi:MAG: hypothetical protein R2711_17045 [Acidimicrobiales bacterium]
MSHCFLDANAELGLRPRRSCGRGATTTSPFEISREEEAELALGQGVARHASRGGPPLDQRVRRAGGRGLPTAYANAYRSL